MATQTRMTAKQQAHYQTTKTVHNIVWIFHADSSAQDIMVTKRQTDPPAGGSSQIIIHMKYHY
ncbi:hypothetical protein [Sphingobacterium nematocida]|uniref:hypothetical protein n=1 Tax=Sphingobacterium nematocida TaxID=1513896 RepID=UPI0009A78E05|nr:hypothetical protein [Sphingobacterium nematocida]